MSKNLLVIQGGGPTAVFNASLASIIREQQILAPNERVYGARFGMKGFVADDLIDITELPFTTLQRLRHTPGAALGSSRFAPTPEDLQLCLQHLRNRRIEQIIFLGGNGTMKGAQRFSDFCHGEGFDVQVIGCPKTIDNDICVTDRCPGFGSAARFVAQSATDLSADLCSLHQPVSIFETLGRDVGWLAAAATLSKRDLDDAPHVVCVPEVPFELDRFLGAIEDAVSRLGWVMAVVSEGIAYADGTPVFEQLLPQNDGERLRPLIGGVAQHLSGLVAQHLGLRSRSEKPGLIGRSSTAHVASQDLRDAEACGRECVRALQNEATDSMVALRPLLPGTEDARCELLPLADVAGLRRSIPQDWLDRENPVVVNSRFQEYAAPLVGALAFPEKPFTIS